MKNSDQMRKFFDQMAPNWDNLPAEAEIRDALAEKMAIPKAASLRISVVGKAYFSHIC